ncbi:MAG TPA: CinA family protein [Pseudonocardiaceae bacterium]|nr:CinA family protein [Pseudonocardiaceae bacterium]
MGDNGHAERSRLATSIAELVDAAGLDVVVTESLTGGMLASALAEAPGSSRWFRGAIVAYASEVKHELLATTSTMIQPKYVPERSLRRSGCSSNTSPDP